MSAFLKTRLSENTTRGALLAIVGAGLALLGGAIDLGQFATAVLVAAPTLFIPDKAVKALLIPFALLLAVSACQDGKLSPAALQVASVLCVVDGFAQPVAVDLIGSYPGAEPFVAFDQALVHPAIVAACAKINGTPVAVEK